MRETGFTDGKQHVTPSDSQLVTPLFFPLYRGQEAADLFMNGLPFSAQGTADFVPTSGIRTTHDNTKHQLNGEESAHAFHPLPPHTRTHMHTYLILKSVHRMSPTFV